MPILSLILLFIFLNFFYQYLLIFSIRNPLSVSTVPISHLLFIGSLIFNQKLSVKLFTRWHLNYRLIVCILRTGLIYKLNTHSYVTYLPRVPRNHTVQELIPNPYFHVERQLNVALLILKYNTTITLTNDVIVNSMHSN